MTRDERTVQVLTDTQRRVVEGDIQLVRQGNAANARLLRFADMMAELLGHEPGTLVISPDGTALLRRTENGEGDDA